ncbi:MAG: elongation factor G [Ignavibacteriales bacterium]|nr:elongation factor G [Ignavibacteriales bacterium]
MGQTTLQKEYLPGCIRTIACIGHGGSGKTTFAEAALFAAGMTNRQGKVDDGSSQSDYHHDEIERHISINSSILVADVDGTKINLLDTPGYSDFTGEVKASLRVSETALVFVKSFEGVEVGTEIVWRYVEEYGNAALFVIGKIDHDNADFAKTVAAIKDRFSNDAVVAAFPVGKGPGFTSVVDVITMKLLTFTAGGNGKFTEGPVPADLQEETQRLHEELIEKVAESDEDLLNKFFENGTLVDDEIIAGMKRGILDRKIFPIFAAAPSINVGVQNILNFVSRYCPAPTDRLTVKAHEAGSDKETDVKINPAGPPALFVFKTVSESHVGELSFFKVYSGVINAGMDMLNESNNKSERLGQIYLMNGRDRKEATKLYAGDIGAVVKLKDTHTNNTLSSKAFPIVFPPTVFPDPVISLAILPKSKGEEDKIGNGLHTLHEEDPTFVVRYDPETKQTVISGQGELHLVIVINRLKEKFGVDVEMVEPRIPFKETIKGVVPDVEYKHKKQSGGRGQYGHVHLKIEPKPRGSGFEFDDAIVGGVVPGRFVPAVEKGIVDAMVTGVIAGYQVIDVKATLHYGSYHDVDSDEMSFKIAGKMAFRKGFKDARPILLEPIYEVEVAVPEEYMGDVMGDLSSRRGKILGMDSNGSAQVIKALVPLKELHRYSTTLRSMTQGRGLHRQKMSHYDEVPHDVAAKIIDEYEKSKQAEE